MSTTYYILRSNIAFPGDDRTARAGERGTKEEWMKRLPFKEEDFGPLGNWFRVVDTPTIEADICVDVIMSALELHECTMPRHSTRALIQFLDEQEKEASDVTKAYAMRVAADHVRKYAESIKTPTREDIVFEVARRINIIQDEHR